MLTTAALVALGVVVMMSAPLAGQHRPVRALARTKGCDATSRPNNGGAGESYAGHIIAWVSMSESRVAAS
jgi:hypothetical protein